MKTSRPILLLSLFAYIFASIASSCEGKKEHTVATAYEMDSLPFMHATGINTLISDSGVMRYHLVAEEWDIYNKETEPSTWKFMKGMLMERFDKDFHIDLYVQSDTAYLHRQQIWELRGRVVIRNANGDLFNTEELFWDLTTHEMWNHQHMHITTPERELEGTEFRSNEQMTRYSVANSLGHFPVSDTENGHEEEVVNEEEKVDQPIKEEPTRSVKTAKEKKGIIGR